MTADRGMIKSVQLDYGSSGTNVTLVANTTNTSNMVHLPRDDYTVQLINYTTGTSIHGASCVWQVMNASDEAAWFALGTAAQTATSAGAGVTAVGTGFAVTSKYAYGRAVVISTGTGSAEVYLGM